MRMHPFTIDSNARDIKPFVATFTDRIYLGHFKSDRNLAKMTKRPNLYYKIQYKNLVANLSVSST